MDIKKLIKNYIKRVDAQNLSGRVDIINQDRFSKLVAKAIDKEIKDYQAEKSKLRAEIGRLNGVIEGMSKEPPKANVDVSQIIDSLSIKMEDMRKDLSSQIERQIAAATATSEDARASVVDMQGFLDNLFKQEDLETNIKVVKETKKKMKIDPSGLKKLRNKKSD